MQHVCVLCGFDTLYQGRVFSVSEFGGHCIRTLLDIVSEYYPNVVPAVNRSDVTTRVLSGSAQKDSSLLQIALGAACHSKNIAIYQISVGMNDPIPIVTPSCVLLHVRNTSGPVILSPIASPASMDHLTVSHSDVAALRTNGLFRLPQGATPQVVATPPRDWREACAQGWQVIHKEFKATNYMPAVQNRHSRLEPERSVWTRAW